MDNLTIDEIDYDSGRCIRRRYSNRPSCLVLHRNENVAIAPGRRWEWASKVHRKHIEEVRQGNMKASLILRNWRHELAALATFDILVYIEVNSLPPVAISNELFRSLGIPVPNVIVKHTKNSWALINRWHYSEAFRSAPEQFSFPQYELIRGNAYLT